MTSPLEEYLEHFGVKGMKWGVRRDGRSTASAPAHPDATTSNALKSLAKSSGTDALSNADLKKAIDRMNLEQQFSRLSGGTKSSGSKFIKQQLANIGKQQIGQISNQLIAKQVAKALAKTAVGA